MGRYKTPRCKHCIEEDKRLERYNCKQHKFCLICSKCKEYWDNSLKFQKEENNEN